MFGEEREYLTIKILHNDMTVMVPCENAGLAGLRRVIDEETVKKVLAVLADDVSEMPKNWNRRFKHNRDKIKTGDIYELAEVVRNLAIREHQKGLSTGEKQMFTRAKKILASELMYALEMDEDGAEQHLDHLLQRADRPFDHRTARQVGERLGDRLPKAFATTRGHDERDRQYRSYAAATFAPADSASRLSRCSSASVSSLSSAYISSEARIFLARVNICFSPGARPF